MVPPALYPFLHMIRLMPVLTVIVAVSTCSLHAGASNKNGSPFSQNGTFFNNSGTYTAIMRGQNLMGVSQFSVFSDGTVPSSGWNMLNGASSNNITPSTTNNIGAPGFVSLYYNGSSYNGTAFSVVDPGGNQIGSVFYTYKAGGAQWDPGQTNIVISSTNLFLTNISTIVITNSNPVVTAYTNSDYTTNIYTTNSYYSNVVTTLTNLVIFITNTTYFPGTNPPATENTSTNITTTTVLGPYTYTNFYTLTNSYTNIITNTSVNLSTNYEYTYSNQLVTNIISTNALVTNTIGSGGGYNYYDGYWNANLQNKYPTQVFYGNGAVSLGQSGDPSNPSPINQANGTANVRQIPFSVQGTRVSGSTSQIY